MLEALERSLHVTQVIWQTDEAQWPKTLRLDKPKSNRRWLRPVAAAAGILLVLGVAAMWLLSESSEKPRVIGKEPTAAERRRKEEEARSMLNNCKTQETFFVLKVSDVLLASHERKDYRYRERIVFEPGLQERDHGRFG